MDHDATPLANSQPVINPVLAVDPALATDRTIDVDDDARNSVKTGTDVIFVHALASPFFDFEALEAYEPTPRLISEANQQLLDNFLCPYLNDGINALVDTIQADSSGSWHKRCSSQGFPEDQAACWCKVMLRSSF